MQASDAMPTLWYPKTPVFPMRHAFIHGSSSGLNPDPTSSWVLVSMADLFAFLGSDGVKLCPIYVERTRKSPWLKPLSDYVSVAKDVGTQSGSRRYKYAEGLVNLQVTKKGALLPDHTDVLTVFRSCHKGCTALAWIEKVTTTNIKERMLQVLFTSYRPSARYHTPTCVPLGTTERQKPLIAKHVAVKQLMRVHHTRPMDVEAGVVPIDLRAGFNAELLQTLANVSVRMARDASSNIKRVGHEGLGDFDAIHHILQRELQKTIGDRRSA